MRLREREEHLFYPKNKRMGEFFSGMGTPGMSKGRMRPSLMYARRSSGYPWRGALQQSLLPFCLTREVANLRPLILRYSHGRWEIWRTALNHCTHPMDDLVADGIEDGHLVLALRELP